MSPATIATLAVIVAFALAIAAGALSAYWRSR